MKHPSSNRIAYYLQIFVENPKTDRCHLMPTAWCQLRLSNRKICSQNVESHVMHCGLFWLFRAMRKHMAAWTTANTPNISMEIMTGSHLYHSIGWLYENIFFDATVFETGSVNDSFCSLHEMYISSKLKTNSHKQVPQVGQISVHTIKKMLNGALASIGCANNEMKMEI